MGRQLMNSNVTLVHASNSKPKIQPIAKVINEVSFMKVRIISNQLGTH